MKYVKDMQICNKNYSEIIDDIFTPAVINIECDYELEGLCVYTRSK